ncbi:tetratricopeptide repeat protein [Methylobacterium sp. Leaf456]|uniref:tetratricopeptide repeat protein n=1 Tax=Methylobacterium sp. Leaf456 TaxID=1736382 RepID=UPI00138EE5BF|nr:tetratricopeptide repeat protein [Methylobacterium sp. Leaf456]
MGAEDVRLGSPPAHASFGALLRWHLQWGTRPSGRAGRPGKSWGRKDFAAEINVSERSLNNWLNDRNVPDNLLIIESKLFGTRIEHYSEIYGKWCSELRIAHDLTRQKIKNQKPTPESEPERTVAVDTAIATNIADLIEFVRSSGRTANAQKQGFSELAIRNIVSRLGGEGISREDLLSWIDNWIENALKELGKRSNEDDAFEAARREAEMRFQAGRLKDASAAFVEELQREEAQEQEYQEKRQDRRLSLLEEAIRFDELAINPEGVVKNLRWMAKIKGIDGPKALGDWFVARSHKFYKRGVQSGQNALLLIAIAVYRAAAEEQTRERDPHQWASIQNKLANALLILGGRESGTARLVEAVATYHLALKEFTRKRAPINWAKTQNNLACALETIGGRESNTVRLKEAVIAYRRALKESPYKRNPHQWASIQNNLANTLVTLGERESGTVRLKQAVAAYRLVLKEFTRERVPLDWSRIQNNLASALVTLGKRESSTTRLKEAVDVCHAALEVRTRKHVPLDWARTQQNLASALVTLGARENSTVRLEEAIDACHNALKERIREQVPLDWAETQHTLANVFAILGEREGDTTRLEKAAAAYGLALEERTREHVPLDWAETQHTLADVLVVLGGLESDTARLEQAVTAYTDISEERIHELGSRKWTEIQRKLDLAAKELQTRRRSVPEVPPSF